MNSSIRIVLAFIIGFLVGSVISFLNRPDLLLSLQAGFIFAVNVTVIVAILSWGVDITVKKGYPDWVGFFLVLILNILGLLILGILPNKTMTSN